MSWNIELGRNIEQAAADIQAIDELQSLDILLVQEMAPDSVAELAARLSVDYRYAAPASHTKTGTLFGNAVLSAWPMQAVIETALPHTAAVMGQQRSVASAVVTIDGIDIAAHSVHLETVLLSTRRRVAQVEQVVVGQTGKQCRRSLAVTSIRLRREVLANSTTRWSLPGSIE